MSLEAGTRLGSFEVIRLLGVGGMGEVYRALDTKLGREVALDIAGQIQAVLTPEEERAFTLADSVDPEARDAYMRGRYLWNRCTPEAIREAIAFFEEAT